jgi:hypothetical protein
MGRRIIGPLTKEQWRQKSYRERSLCKFSFNSRYHSHKNNAAKRGLDFLLTKEEFRLYWEQPCFYCGQDLSSPGGLDRLDNTRGYNVDNCVPACFDCNRTKNDKNFEEFVEYCRMITDKFTCSVSFQ